MLLAAVAMGPGGTRPLTAQDAAPRFEYPLASPRVNAIAGRLIVERLGDSQFGPQTEGEAILGEDIPIIRLRGGSRPIVLGFGAQVYGRFSLSDRKSSQISTDWLVGPNVLADLGDVTVVAHLYHESSHLGDEYEETFDANRIDWTREVASGWFFLERGRARLAVNLSYVLADELDLPPLGAAVGLDLRGDTTRVGSLAVQPFTGIFVRGEGATDWRLSASFRAGVSFPSNVAGGSLSLAFVAYDGLSTQRQFFTAESRYLGAEIRLDL